MWLDGDAASMVTQRLLGGINALGGIMWVHLICGDGRIHVEGDQCYVGNLRAGCQAAFEADRV